MKTLLINLIVFIVLIEVLARVDFLVLLSALGVAIAVIVCTHLWVRSLSSSQ
jgi:hypothetical protein